MPRMRAKPASHSASLGLCQAEESLRILVGTEGDSFPLMEINAGETEASEQWDYVLVADRRTQRNPRQACQQRRFLEELRTKGFHYKVMEDREKVFFGVRADSRIFDLYRTLLMEPEGPAARVQPARPAPIPATTRIRIVNFVLNSKTAAGDTLEDLVKNGVFETRFALHKGEDDLKKKWAQWRNMVHKQPIDDIRDYFGEKVALYFAWLGWYTYMLVPAAVAGLVIFLSGFSLFNASQISKEICEADDILLCPRGDHGRKYQRLSDTCMFAKLTHLFDNEGTVLFAIFMALWATVFLEIWKRQRARVVLHWDLYGWDEDQEEMALELINCPDYKLRPHQHSYLRSTAILTLCLLMICLMIGMAHVLVVYRVLAAALFNSALLFQEEQVTTAVVVTGALVHYVAILITTKVNKRVALKLCDFEKPRTFSERESKFTVKFFTLQLFAHFSSLVYIAFILGRINGHPGKSVRLAGLWRLEECHLSGCMMDLFLQMAIIMGLKQTLSNCMEYLGPWLAHKCRLIRVKLGHASEDPELRDWRRNYLLNPVNTFSLFDEFMEMMIQYGFTTIFVAAFPLAPLLALFSNLVEIRLDAIKMVRLQRRLVPRKAKDIGQGPDSVARSTGAPARGGVARGAGTSWCPRNDPKISPLPPALPQVLPRLRTGLGEWCSGPGKRRGWCAPAGPCLPPRGGSSLGGGGAQAEELGSESPELREGGVQQLGAGTKRWPPSPRLSLPRWPGIREEQRGLGAGCGQRERWGGRGPTLGPRLRCSDPGVGQAWGS
ncbi:anoctamin-9 isoform X1 [Acinonyx jubatus]|uniref:Anoctamin n=1 Tax=Acinonyx jubatus TaxID=32536 RepID=A0ABM3NGU9_ACIJB|nr:anoctamin-9 isoform X1 [Acinonyx jubatus]